MGLTRPPEGLERFQKKGKSSEFNPLNYEQVKSSPSLKVWSLKNVKDTVNLPKKFDFGAKNIFLKIEKNNARTKTKVFLDSNGQKLFRTIEKT